MDGRPTHNPNGETKTGNSQTCNHMDRQRDNQFDLPYDRYQCNPLSLWTMITWNASVRVWCRLSKHSWAVALKKWLLTFPKWESQPRDHDSSMFVLNGLVWCRSLISAWTWSLTIRTTITTVRMNRRRWRRKMSRRRRECLSCFLAVGCVCC